MSSSSKKGLGEEIGNKMGDSVFSKLQKLSKHVTDSSQDNFCGKLTLVHIIHCRTSRGRFSTGRKVTGIEFLNVNIVMVTTNDSRIRFIDIRNPDNKVVYKIKGHKNEQFPIRASVSDDLAHVLCASEDGNVFLWSQI
jgi:hypothetical protein